MEGKARGCVPQARFDQESLARCHVREQHAPAVPCTYGRDGAERGTEWRGREERPRAHAKLAKGGPMTDQPVFGNRRTFECETYHRNRFTMSKFPCKSLPPYCR